MTTPSAARAVARERRDAREPHTLSDVSYLESQPAPRLNNLSGSTRANGDATSASFVLQQFSSVSPHHAGFSSANDSGGGGMFFPPFPAPFSFTCPQDVPWIPPPPIPALDTSAQWPTPRDIPLPSSFPFPPFAIPPPPPPWGLPQQMAQQQQAQQMAQQQQQAQQMAQQQQQAQQMTRQDQKLREPRGLKGPPRGPLAARDAPLRHRPTRTERSRSCSSSMDSCCNAWAQSLRVASPPSRPARGSSAQRRATQKTPKRILEPRLAEQRNYYTAARAVKGSAPCLADELARRRTPSRLRAYGGAAAAREDSIPRQEAKDAAARNSNARVGEYLKGIEDLYQRLRESYEEFQRDPSSFVKNAAELKDAALASAPSVQTLFDGAPQPSQALKPTAPQEQTEPQQQPQQQSQQPSAESQRLREELMRLEMQWQRLEELKRGCTGERGAGPVEIVQTRRGGAAPEGIAVTRELEPRRGGGAMGMASRSSTPGGASHRSHSDSSDGNRQLFTRDRLLGLVRERKAMMD